jgi:glucosamine kinase
LADLKYLIGVDGGGTGCRVAVADASGTVLGRAQGGPANIATDYAIARENIINAVHCAWQQAGHELDSMNSAACVLGLAGANVGQFAKQMKDSLPFQHCIVTDDRATTVEGALGSEDGCIAVVGTGSFYSSRYQGVATDIGGWGFLVGDDGGGARLGQELLRRVIHCYDGIHQHSGLTRKVLSEFDNSPKALVEFAMKARANDFGTFVPAIVEAARDGDIHAVALVRASVEAIQTCIDKVGYIPSSRLYLLGGLGPILREFMHADYSDASIHPRGDALFGAISMAQQLINSKQS